MPYYTCSTATCPSGGVAFSLTSAGQTFCPQCGMNSLRAAPTPVVAPTTRTRVITTSNAMDAVGGNAAEVDDLIAKWDLNTVSDTEAAKKKDYVYKLGTDKRKRIDREEPVTNGSRVITHSKFRLQFGTKTHAGVWIRVNEILNAATIRQAFRESVNAGRYVEVYLE